MAAGVPLTDEHREPWVGVLVRELRAIARQGRSSVLAFSGLRAVHRQRLRDSGVPMRFVFLHAMPSVIAERLATRTGHFMPPTQLANQLGTLQTPADALRVDVTGTPEQVVAVIREGLGL